MSPALHLFGWLASGRWRPALVAAGGAIALSVLTLPLVDFESQLAFYTDILPGFASGEYHGLKVPITLPANHSIPDLFNQLWPGPDRHHLSASAAHATRAVSLLALGVLLWVFRHARGTTGLACGFGAVTVLATITPVYTYEHHLSFLLFPAVALYAAHRDRLLSRWMTAPALAAGVLIACPLYVLRPLQKALPPLAWALQESKFAGSLALGVLCAVAAWRSGTLSDSEARLRTPPGK